MKKTVLITGASSGFGEACAKIYGGNGYNLILTARREARLQALQSTLVDANVIYEVFDVRDKNAVYEFIAGLPDRLKSAQFESLNIDILINNAGLALGIEPAPQALLDDWETMIDTNIKGVIYFTKAVLPIMLENTYGHIVNLGSIAGNWPYVGGNVYGATKAFVKQFSNNLRADLLGSNIRVTNIEPGLAESEFSIIRLKGDKERAGKIYEGTQPLTPKNIAEIIYWVTSQPDHVNINSLEVMPTCQAWDSLKVHKEF